MLSRNRFWLLDRKNRYKSPDHLFDLNFFDSMLHTITFQYSVQSFYLSFISTSKKFFSLCCSVFLSFCPCFSFCSFAILKLDFSLKNILAINKNSSPSWKYLFPLEVNYFNRDTNLSNQLMMSYVLMAEKLIGLVGLPSLLTMPINDSW